jgi:hypothetical protein
MEREYVQSSMIKSFGFDSSSSTLEVEFKGGMIYQYFDVPEHEYDSLMNFIADIWKYKDTVFALL